MKKGKRLVVILNSWEINLLRQIDREKIGGVNERQWYCDSYFFRKIAIQLMTHPSLLRCTIASTREYVANTHVFVWYVHRERRGTRGTSHLFHSGLKSQSYMYVCRYDDVDRMQKQVGYYKEQQEKNRQQEQYYTTTIPNYQLWCQLLMPKE